MKIQLCFLSLVLQYTSCLVAFRLWFKWHHVASATVSYITPEGRGLGLGFRNSLLWYTCKLRIFVAHTTGIRATNLFWFIWQTELTHLLPSPKVYSTTTSCCCPWCPEQLFQLNLCDSFAPYWQIVVNLVANAFHQASQGAVRIRATEGSTQLSIRIEVHSQSVNMPLTRSHVRRMNEDAEESTIMPEDSLSLHVVQLLVDLQVIFFLRHLRKQITICVEAPKEKKLLEL